MKQFILIFLTLILITGIYAENKAIQQNTNETLVSSEAVKILPPLLKIYPFFLSNWYSCHENLSVVGYAPGATDYDWDVHNGQIISGQGTDRITINPGCTFTIITLTASNEFSSVIHSETVVAPDGSGDKDASGIGMGVQ